MIRRVKSKSVVNLIILLSLLMSLFSSTGGSAFGAVGDGSPSDTNFKYVGRWDNTSSTVYKSYWSGAYFRVNFTGTTVKLKLAAPADIYVSIDGGADVLYTGATGTVNLTPTPLASGTHTLRVAARSESVIIQFQGLILDSGASTQPPVARSKLVEFIGASSVAGCCALSKYALSDFAWLAGEYLNADHTQVAYSGMTLIDGVNSMAGMEKQFFRLQNPTFPNSPLWDFSRYEANAVVIHYGTNDHNSGISDATFQTAFTTFLLNVRAKYPNAEIFVLRTWNGEKATALLNSVTARHQSGDSHVHYVDTGGWVTPGTSDFSDALHPSNTGHLKIAKRLAPLIAKVANWDTAFTDNFNDGNANGWTAYGPSWSVVGGQYHVTANPGSKSMADGTAYSNFIYEADVAIGAAGNAGLLFRASEPATGLYNFSGYYAYLEDNHVKLGKAQNNWTLLTTAPMTITPNTLYHIKVDVAGSRIKVYVNDMNTPKINITDTSFVAGAIGLRTYNSAAKFDNISVKAFSRFESFNVPAAYIRHYDYRARISRNINIVEDSEWRIVPGLADATAVSFESVNLPGHYLRHRAGQVWADPSNGTALFKADATWRIRPGLWDSTKVSIQSYNYPTGYMRHANSLMTMVSITTDLDKKDATFTLY